MYLFIYLDHFALEHLKTLALVKSGERQASSSVREAVETRPARTPVSRLKQRTRHSVGVD